MKRSIAIILTLAIMLTAALIPAGADPEYSTGTYEVAANKMYVRSAASQQSSPNGIIEKGTRVEITIIQNGWGYGTYGEYNEKTGWFMLSCLTKISEIAPENDITMGYTLGKYIVKSEILNFRQQHSQDSAKLDVLVDGDIVEIVELYYGWGRCIYHNMNGWIYLSYCEKYDENAAAETTTGSPETTEPETTEPATTEPATTKPQETTSAETTTEAPSVINYTPGEYKVTTERLNFREGPGSGYGYITYIPEGTVITVTSVEREIWGKTAYAGYEGYCCLEYAEKTASAPPAETTTETPVAPPVKSYTLGQYKVIADKQYYRENADKSSKNLGVIEKNTLVDVYSVENREWGKAIIGGVRCFVMLSVMEKVKSAEVLGNAVIVDQCVNGNDTDFEKLAEDGFSAVILHLGKRTDTRVEFDTDFRELYKKAKDAGLGVGCCFDSVASNTDAALSEAEKVGSFLTDNGYELDYPMFYKIKSVTQEKYEDIIKVFIDNTGADINVGVMCNTYIREKIGNKAPLDAYYWVTETNGPASLTCDFCDSQTGITVPGCTGKVSTGFIFSYVHNYTDWKQTKAPTCNEFGEETANCVCCSRVRTRKIAPLGHTPGAYSSEPDEKGYLVSLCTVCGETAERKLADFNAPDHEHFPTDSWMLRDDKTCGMGVYVLKCKYCTKTLYEKYSLIGTHVPGDVERETDICEQDGYLRIHCKYCGEIFDEFDMPKTGHRIFTWNVQKQPTATETGMKNGQCVYCNTVITKIMPALIKGDADGNGKVTADDARTILRICADLAAADEDLFSNCDYDSNGSVTASDARAVLMKVADVS